MANISHDYPPCQLTLTGRQAQPCHARRCRVSRRASVGSYLVGDCQRGLGLHEYSPGSHHASCPVRATRDTFEKIGTYEIPDSSPLCPRAHPGLFNLLDQLLRHSYVLHSLHAPNVFSPSMRKALCWPRDLACPCFGLPVPPAPPFFPFAPPITPSSADVPHTSPALPHRESAWQGQPER
jgi:hypothetical protein